MDYVRMFQKLSEASKRRPKRGYHKRVIAIEVSDECDAGGEVVLRYELTRTDLAALIRAVRLSDKEGR